VQTTSSGLTIRLNNITGNAGLDIFWDGEGEQTFTENSCGTANQPKLCKKQVSCAAGSRCAAQERAWPDLLDDVSCLDQNSSSGLAGMLRRKGTEYHRFVWGL
jgi:hypothetical protein